MNKEKKQNFNKNQFPKNNHLIPNLNGKETKLHIFCRNNESITNIKKLIEKGSDINAKDYQNETPLHLVCRYQKNENSFEIIKFLIEKGADINAKNYQNQIPLHLACQYQQNENTFQIIKFLVENKADINAKNYQNQTPLHIVCQYQQNENTFQIIKFLVENKADINVKSKYDQIPLHLICQYQQQNSLRIIKFLIENGADFNSIDVFDQTFLHFACQCQHENVIQVLKYLIKKGVDINAKTKDNQTALHFTCEYQRNENSFEIIKLLVEKGIDINAKNNWNHETPLHLTCEYHKHPKSFQIVKYLIEKGADVNAKTKENQSPLHFACQYQHKDSIQIIKYLVENKADINVRNMICQTPLHVAFEYQSQNENSFEIIKYLIGKGADVNAKTKERYVTALHLACKYQNEKSNEIIKLLIEKGADINARNNKNQVPLQIANSNHDRKKIQILLMNDADIFNLEESQITQEIIEFFPKIYSLNQDLNNFLKSNENFPDFQIKSNDSFNFNLHKQILLSRFDNDYSILNKFVNICSQKSKEIVQLCITFLYTGFPDFDNFIERFHNLINYKTQIIQTQKYQNSNDILQNEFFGRIGMNYLRFRNKEIEIEKCKKQNEIIEEFFKEIGLDLNWINIKKGRKGIIKDFQKFYQENESKNFTIICEEKEIKVHKLILMIRSELFKGMFLSVEDSSNEVHDYTGKTFETIQQIIYFIYNDEIEENKITKQIIQELEDVKDYYQLNQNSFLDLILFYLIQNIELY
ncbi:ankyrin repeat protein [Anaeramoeba ignava]|uniref:Ankyrin repeat protein n=1 Tax=Anaeramoeba ignava TaxID=1746090 RepID=A0A9Q0LH64_ANAIG|nr:ankyrin repeat protein [Anaeramoeba ignava]